MKCVPKFSLSVISHGHGVQVINFLNSLLNLKGGGFEFDVYLTLNIPEPLLRREVESREWGYEVNIIDSDYPLGFGKNHNRAFCFSTGEFFAVVNPDVYFLPVLEAGVLDSFLEIDSSRVGLLVPKQIDSFSQTQDFCRLLPTPLGISRRIIDRIFNRPTRVGWTEKVESADWVNGACLFFPREVYQALGGFDERYFMYCEDADLCLRLQLKGWRMQSAPFTVVHDAQRGSLRPGKHLRWHVTSLLRFWCSSAFWRYWFRSWKPFNRVTSVKS